MGLVDTDEESGVVQSNLVQRSTVFARLPQNINLRDDITNYGVDNLYAQRMEEIALRSPTTLSAMAVWADFIKGNGFEFNGDLVVNRYGETLNDLLRLVAPTLSMYASYSLHFNINQLGLITEITAVQFDNVRYGLPDEKGRHFDVKVSNNWEKNRQKTPGGQQIIEPYDLWNQREKVMQDLEDVVSFPGFIHYKVKARDKYPLTTFDSVADSVQTEGEIQVFELASTQNSFLGASIMKIPNEIESQKERDQMRQDLFNLTGPNNANSVLIVEDIPENFNLLEQVPANNSDNLFQNTNINTRDRIVMNYKVPSPLLGIQPSGGVFNQEDQLNSYLAMNAKTRDARFEVVEDFEKFLKFWHEGPVVVGSILESTFNVITKDPEAGTVEQSNPEETPKTKEIDTTTETENPEEVKKLVEEKTQKETSFNGAQISSALDIINRVTLGELSQAQGVTALMEFLRISEEIALKLLSE